MLDISKTNDTVLYKALQANCGPSVAWGERRIGVADAVAMLLQ